jgi:hypothetical protein
VHAELQEEDVLLYAMEEEETTSCMARVMNVESIKDYVNTPMAEV